MKWFIYMKLSCKSLKFRFLERKLSSRKIRRFQRNNSSSISSLNRGEEAVELSMVGEVEAAEMQLNSGAGDLRPRSASLSISRKFRPRSQSQVMQHLDLRNSETDLAVLFSKFCLGNYKNERF